MTALTHQAIDNVLKKVVTLVKQYLPGDFSGRCIKWGRQPTGFHMPDESADPSILKVEYTNNAEEIFSHPLVIVGATGYGFYSLFDTQNNQFSRVLDWVIFDEASQVTLPAALLPLVYAKDNFIFSGDVNQLPPIIQGNYEEAHHQDMMKPDRSIIENFYNQYPDKFWTPLDVTYRMNREICDFPSKMWYQGALYPAPSNADTKLGLPAPDHTTPFPLDRCCDAILDPEKPVVLVITRHQGCTVQSETEANLIAMLAFRLMTKGIQADQMALISPPQGPE